MCPPVSHRRGVRRALDPRARSHEPVAATRQGFHKAGTLRGIAQGFAQPVDDGIEAVVDVHEGIRRPQLLPELVPGDDFTCVLQETCQYLKRMLLELDMHPLLAQLPSVKVGLESSKP